MRLQNLDKAGAAALVTSLNAMDCTDCEVVVAPVALHIPAVVGSIKPEIAVSAQNCNFKVRLLRERLRTLPVPLCFPTTQVEAASVCLS